jgi:hypothetical protein
MKLIRNYGTIDAYSQGKLKDKPLPTGMSARNMYRSIKTKIITCNMLTKMPKNSKPCLRAKKPILTKLLPIRSPTPKPPKLVS